MSEEGGAVIPVCEVAFKPGTEEELLPQYHPDFPHISTCAEFREPSVQHYPWHWHKAVEIFYIERGQLVHSTPSDEIVFPAGSGGFLNSNILHSAKARACDSGHRRLHHLFDPALIAGGAGSRIEQHYVLPLLAASHIEIIPLRPDDPQHLEILALIRDSFQLTADGPGYELRIRNVLSEIWLRVMRLMGPQLSQAHPSDRPSALIKQMMLYVHAHHREKLTVADLADSAGISTHACYSLFQKCLHTTPSEYINSCKLGIAYQMLAQTEASVAEISAACGMDNSYFSQVFRQATGYTPLEYRRFYRRLR